MLKVLIPVMAALALTACATTDKPGDGAQVARIGNWEIRPNNPFRTEEGPLERYTDDEENTALATSTARPLKR